MSYKNIQRLVDERISIRISEAIERRKKEVNRQIKIYTASVSGAFAILLAVGFTTDDLIKKLRERAVPPAYISETFTSGDEADEAIRKILSELSNLENHEEVGESLSEHALSTLAESTRESLLNIMNQSQLDELVIELHSDEVDDILFNPSRERNDLIELISQKGVSADPVIIGHYANESGSLTNCNLPFDQAKRQVILHYPPSSRLTSGKDAHPWIRCPLQDRRPFIWSSLIIANVTISDVMIVGVERPVPTGFNQDVQGIRARVTRGVVDAFSEQGIELGSHVTGGFIRLDRASLSP